MYLVCDNRYAIKSVNLRIGPELIETLTIKLIDILEENSIDNLVPLYFYSKNNSGLSTPVLCCRDAGRSSIKNMLKSRNKVTVRVCKSRYR